ncbi:MAG: TRAP transporter small permease [Synergistetes bacterium]|nr:MAG: TRAP transporter, small permease subunit [bacterium 42_11]MBC7332549.1 TRAP transporter small permease [Synergistota bacterium]MDK2871408.1 hypothetical protein [bacterium]
MSDRRDVLEEFLEWGMFISFGSLVIIVTLSVITRFFLPFIILSWSEEASRFFFIYTVAFGAPCALKRGEFATVDVFFNRLPVKVRRRLLLVFDVTTVIFFSIVFFYSFQFAKLGLNQYSPTMGIPMVFAYSSMILTSMFMVFYSFLRFWKAVTRGGEILE